eukprot:1961450-Amphidinium_carterae.1
MQADLRRITLEIGPYAQDFPDKECHCVEDAPDPTHSEILEGCHLPSSQGWSAGCHLDGGGKPRFTISMTNNEETLPARVKPGNVYEAKKQSLSRIFAALTRKTRKTTRALRITLSATMPC